MNCAPKKEALLERRISFAEQHCRSKEGRRFDRSKRPWIVRDFWRPVDGFRKAAINSDHLCRGCKQTAGEILGEWSWGVDRELRAHRELELALTPDDFDDAAAELSKVALVCEGLGLEPILVTVLNLPRREGKTFNSACWILSTICLQRNRNVLFVAAAGKQTERIFREAFVRVIEQDEKLAEVCHIVGQRIEVESTGSVLQIADTSFRSITGSGFSHIVIDECRDVHPRVVAAAIFSSGDQNGAECPLGHCMLADVDPEEIGSKKCNTCGERLVPWYPRVILTSSSGIIDDSEFAWFNELADALEELGHPMAHLYRSHDSNNPSVSKKVKKSYGEIFGAVPQLQTYVEVELTNTPRRLGDDFLTTPQIKRLTKRGLHSLDGDERICVGFLDTSKTGDTTSLVILADNVSAEEIARALKTQVVIKPWARLAMVHLKKWQPKRQEGGQIDPAVIQRHLDAVIPAFPNLRKIGVDVRGMQWAVDFVIWNHRNRPGWGRKLEAFKGQREERDTSWQLFEAHALAATIDLIDDPDLLAELRGVRRIQRTDGTIEIRDRNRKKRHADIIEGVAGGCLYAYRESMRPTITLAQADRGAGHLASLFRPSARFKPGDF